MPTSHINSTSTICSESADVIMKIGLLPDVVEPRIQCARTHWIQGFMTFRTTDHAGCQEHGNQEEHSTSWEHSIPGSTALLGAQQHQEARLGAVGGYPGGRHGAGLTPSRSRSDRNGYVQCAAMARPLATPGE